MKTIISATALAAILYFSLGVAISSAVIAVVMRFI
jgi:hypothetical protein